MSKEPSVLATAAEISSTATVRMSAAKVRASGKFLA